MTPVYFGIRISKETGFKVATEGYLDRWEAEQALTQYKNNSKRRKRLMETKEADPNTNQRSKASRDLKRLDEGTVVVSLDLKGLTRSISYEVA